jgi:hypothetical protein
VCVCVCVCILVNSAAHHFLFFGNWFSWPVIGILRGFPSRCHSFCGSKYCGKGRCCFSQFGVIIVCGDKVYSPVEVTTVPTSVKHVERRRILSSCGVVGFQ